MSRPFLDLRLGREGTGQERSLDIRADKSSMVLPSEELQEMIGACLPCPSQSKG